LLSQDQAIKKMTELEIEALSKENEKEFDFIQIGSSNPAAMKITLSQDISIGDLKSYLLTKTDDGLGFYLEHFLNNNQTLKELQDKSSDANTIKVYLIENHSD